jgi:hypothetical protein
MSNVMRPSGYSLFFRRTPERRQLDDLRYIGASDETAKEVQLFGLAPWLVEHHRTLSERFYQENKRLSIAKGIISTALSSVGTLGYSATFVITLVRAVQGSITISVSTSRTSSTSSRCSHPSAHTRGTSGSPRDPPGIYVRRRGLSRPWQRRLGAAARELPLATRRARRVHRRERRGEDHAHQTARTTLRSDGKAHLARYSEPLRYSETDTVGRSERPPSMRR